VIFTCFCFTSSDQKPQKSFKFLFFLIGLNSAFGKVLPIEKKGCDKHWLKPK
jgi:hypothetical protein